MPAGPSDERIHGICLKGSVWLVGNPETIRLQVEGVAGKR